ncbi:MAG: ankyrin repeat domain-containing protein [bacterium]
MQLTCWLSSSVKTILTVISTALLVTEIGAKEVDTELSIAVQAGNVNAAEEALKKGADINHVDDEWPLFVTAVTSNDIKMVKFFLDNGVNTELVGPDGKTALMHSLSLRNGEMTAMIVKAEANLRATDPAGKNIMMYAAEGNNPLLLKLLLDMGFDRNVRSKADKTPLDYAVDARAAECSRILSKLDTLPIDFLSAVEKGDASLVRNAINSGVDINIKDKNGKAAILIAIEKSHTNIVRLLLEKGVDPSANYFKNKDATLLTYAIHNGKLAEAVLLLKAGAKANFNHRYKDGKSALIIAIESSNHSLITLLIEEKQNIDITDSFGRTALMFAAESNMFSVVSKLLEKGADPTIRQVDGKTASDIAKAKGHLQISKLLTEAEKKWI